MTNHKINVAIAETCGWTEFHTEDFTEMGVPCFVQMALPPGFIHIENSMPLPDYCTDLNAMHEAEETLLKMDGCQAHWETYSNILTMKVGCMDVFHTPARQRAEAYLRTVGKWEEVQP